jgi:branched-chain amino acid transport system permease protein/neutral amino acid transport system permease protein
VRELVTIIAFGSLTAALLSIGSVGFTLQFGVTNVLNLAFGALMTSSIFILYLTARAHTPLWLGVALCACWGAGISLLLSTGIINPYVRRGTSLFGMAMVTIALALIVQYGLETIQGPTILAFEAQTSRLLHFAGVTMSLLQVEIIGLSLVLLVAVHALLRYTRLGLAMRATAADAALTRACGASTKRVRSLAWITSGALCGVSGSLLGLSQGSFNSTTGNAFFILIVAAAIVGGIGQPYGAMLGAAIIGLVTEVSANYISPSYKDVVAFGVLVAVLLIRPRGLLAEFSSERELTR